MNNTCGFSATAGNPKVIRAKAKDAMSEGNREHKM
jgi:hypothetical protein